MARKRSRPSSPPPPPVPVTPPKPREIAYPHPWLATKVPDDVKRAGGTWRHAMMADFYHARNGDEQYEALRLMIMATWPADFVRHASLDPYKIYPTDNWNSWLERLLKGFVNEKYAIRQGDRVVRVIGLTGCASASKSHATSLFATAWYMPDPENSIAVLTSTTKDMIRSRVWSVIRHYATTAIDIQTGEPCELGHLIDSQMKLQSPSKSPKHSIAAYAVAHGETLKAIDNLKGLHAKRMLVVIDEANSTPEAIFNVIPNYKKGCKDLTIIIVGNPVSRLDTHGRALKPADGWPLAMDEKVIEWKTEGVKEWELDSGLALRFDGRDSPNVTLKRNRHPYLYLYEDWLGAEAIRAEKGGNFAYWSQSRGMWPPEGMANIIFTEQLFLRCDAIGTHFTFETESELVCFTDVAFGGDGCILQVGSVGDVGGRKCLQLLDWLDIPIDPAASDHDIDWQIARFIQNFCITRRIKPSCCGLDCTGVGRGVGAILAKEWSAQIQYTMWGQGATERATAQNDGRPARESYYNYVTELWFATRELLEAGQIKGFSRESIGEFCARQYEMKGKKYQAEPKSDMRLRLRYSPDHADAIVGLVEVARRNGLNIEGVVSQSVQREELQARVAVDAFSSDEVHAGGGGWAESDAHDVRVEAEAWE